MQMSRLAAAAAGKHLPARCDGVIYHLSALSSASARAGLGARGKWIAVKSQPEREMEEAQFRHISLLVCAVVRLLEEGAAGKFEQI